MTDKEFLDQYVKHTSEIQAQMEAVIEDMAKTRVAIAEQPKLPPPAMPRLKFKRGKHD